MQIEEYDKIKLRMARKLIVEVYEYYYGAPVYKKETNRLKTIIDKIDFLLNGKDDEQ